MEQNEKKLLFVDLCGRLPYNTLICNITAKLPNDGSFNLTLSSCEINTFGQYIINKWFPIDKVRPYLRPLSSMTEDEKNVVKPISSYNDWLNEHHFDLHGLIEKGLALEAETDMYIISNKNN